MKKYIIFGAGGHAKVIASTLMRSGIEVECFIDPHPEHKEIFQIPVVTNLDNKSFVGKKIALAIGDNNRRDLVASQLLSKFHIEAFEPIIDPKAIIGKRAKIGFGTVVLSNSCVGPDAIIGDFCILNNNTVSDHDTVIGHFASIGPGAALGGHVAIGRRSHIGMGSSVIEKVKIGKDVVIGAGSAVVCNITSNQLAAGVPAKRLKQRSRHDSYLN